MFGILYDQEEDLAAAILEATLATPEKDEAKWEEKLYEISSTNFGRRVYEFYLDAIISKRFLQWTSSWGKPYQTGNQVYCENSKKSYRYACEWVCENHEGFL